MTQNLHKLKRLGYGLLAVFPALGLGMTLLSNTSYAAAPTGGNVANRKINMHSSATSATTTYDVTFTPQTTQASGELVVDFCSNSPVYNDGCNFAATSVPTVGGTVTASTGTGAQITGGTPAHAFKVTGLTLTNGTPITVSITAGLTNPTAAGTFYARILTYATGGAASYVPASTSGNTPTLGSPVDYGGVALSTTSTINVTAKVFETLSFCVYKTSCGTAPAVALGNSNTGALDTTSTYANSDAQYSITSNALNGTNVYMYGQTLCRNATINFTNCPSGASNQTITAATPGSAVAVAKAAAGSAEQFGLCVDTQGTTNLSAQAPYKDTTAANCHGIANGAYAGSSVFGLDDTNGANGTNGTNGSVILASTANNPVSGSDSIVFFGNITPTTEYGTYVSNLNLVATSTY